MRNSNTHSNPKTLDKSDIAHDEPTHSSSFSFGTSHIAHEISKSSDNSDIANNERDKITNEKQMKVKQHVASTMQFIHTAHSPRASQNNRQQ